MNKKSDTGKERDTGSTPEADHATHPKASAETINFFEPLPSTLEAYHQFHEKSVQFWEAYWRRQAERINWREPFTTVVDEEFKQGWVKWFIGGSLNICENALDRHLQKTPHKIDDDGAQGEKAPALVFLSSDGKVQTWSFGELAVEVKKTVTCLRRLEVKRGDRVALWMDGRPEAVFVILACARIGAVYTVLSPKMPAAPLADRMADCAAKVVFVAPVREADGEAETHEKITATGQGASTGVSVSDVVATVEDAVVVDVTGGVPCEGTKSFSEMMAQAEPDPTPPVPVGSEEGLFLLYAQASAGVPRAARFACGGYATQVATSYAQIFAEPMRTGYGAGIVSLVELASAPGQAYGLWGPLLNGHAVVLFEDAEEISAARLFESLETCWPLALLTRPRSLARWRRELGDVELSHKLRFNVAASCGDMLTPRLAAFGGNVLVVSPERLINLWTQSETGVALINTYPYAALNHPGALGLLAPGVQGRVLSDIGEPCRVNESGQLVFCRSWPAMIRSIWNQEERFREIYFSRIDGCFSTNDGMRCDGDGFFWFMRRLDDVVKVQGRSVATSEVESVILSFPEVMEAAVIGLAQEGGDALVAFVAAGEGKAATEKNKKALEARLAAYLKKRVGAFFVPARTYIGAALPRTRSGKVVRRLLRRIAIGDVAPQEDLSHVANPGTVKQLIEDKGE